MDSEEMDAFVASAKAREEGYNAGVDSAKAHVAAISRCEELHVSRPALHEFNEKLDTLRESLEALYKTLKGDERNGFNDGLAGYKNKPFESPEWRTGWWNGIMLNKLRKNARMNKAVVATKSLSRLDFDEKAKEWSDGFNIGRFLEAEDNADSTSSEEFQQGHSAGRDERLRVNLHIVA